MASKAGRPKGPTGKPLKNVTVSVRAYQADIDKLRKQGWSNQELFDWGIAVQIGGEAKARYEKKHG